MQLSVVMKVVMRQFRKVPVYVSFLYPNELSDYLNSHIKQKSCLGPIDITEPSPSYFVKAIPFDKISIFKNTSQCVPNSSDSYTAHAKKQS